MLRKSAELRYWQRDEVLEVLRAAVELTDELAAPEDLRVSAFTKAVDLLGQKHVVMEQVNVGVPQMAIPRGVG